MISKENANNSSHRQQFHTSRHLEFVLYAATKEKGGLD